MRENTVKSHLARGGRVLSGWLSTGDALVAETLGHAGFDAVTVDLQHGASHLGNLLGLMQAISTTETIPLVRVPWNDPAVIMKVLDLGAYGVICPMIEDRADAESFVRACRYPPQGNRSFGPTRGMLYGGSDYPVRSNETILTMAMIETRSAVENLDDILAVAGLDAVFVGPADLSQALGGPSGVDWEDGPVPAVLDRVVDRCRAHGVAAGVFTRSTRYASRMLEQGFQFVTVANDVFYVTTTAASIVAAMRPALLRT